MESDPTLVSVGKLVAEMRQAIDSP
jgi:hypothetical protein